MRDDQSPYKMASEPGHPVHTEPHVGHGGTKFEGADASVKLVLFSLAIIAGTLIIVFALTVGLQKRLYNEHPVGELASPLAPYRIVPPSPQLWVHPWEELPDVRMHEDQILNGYGKDAAGHIHIPIKQAMDAVVTQLPIGPNAAVGIDMPGGQGRDFSTSVNAMPAPYQRPQIQGEIHKRAQK